MNEEATLLCRLYIAGDSPNSRRALANLRELCRRAAPNGHHIEIVDIFADPLRALSDGVMLAPQLLVISKGSVRIVGDLSDETVVLAALGSEVRRS